MKNNFTKTNIFSCPIHKIRIDPNSYDKEKILNDILYNKSFKNRRNDSAINFGNCDIHHSYMDFDNEDFRSIDYEKLVAVYLEIFKEFFEKEIHTKKAFKYNFEIVNYLAATEGQYLPSHSHIKFDDFAAIHYLNFKVDHVPTLFHNPAIFAPFLNHIRPEIYDILDIHQLDNSYLLETFAFPAKEDDMLIFPAALNHQIPPQGPTKEPRISISTNIKVFLEEKKKADK